MRGLIVIATLTVFPIAATTLATGGRMVFQSPSVRLPEGKDDSHDQTSQPISNSLVPPVVWTGIPADRRAESSELPTVDDLLNSSKLYGGLNHAYAHPHGNQVCASGCALSSHPTKKLSVENYRKLLSEFSLDPLSSESKAIEALLYYGRQTKELIDQVGTFPLDDRRADFLVTQLNDDHAIVSFRVVDEHGVIRANLKPTRVPLDIRHEFQVAQR